MLYNIYTKQWKNSRNILSINFIYHIILLIVYIVVQFVKIFYKRKNISVKLLSFFFFFQLYNLLINQETNLIQSEHNFSSV